MIRLGLLASSLAGVLAVAAGAAEFQDPATLPDTRPARRLGPVAPRVPLQVTVVELAGLVRHRRSEADAWSITKVGDVLDEGAEFNTGPRSYVKLRIGDDQLCTLDRLGVVKILRADIESGVIRTEAAMKYGRTNYQIEAAGREHAVTVRSATSTLAVRGTVVELFDQPPFVPQAVSYTGRAMFRDARRQVAIGSRGGSKVVIDADKNSPAETALATTAFDPALSHARTPEEQRLIEQVIATGGQITFEQPFGIPIVRGGTPPSFQAVEGVIGGNGLSFVLKWPGNADLNLSVAPIGFEEIITPVTSLNRGVNTGGATLFDHRGGGNGGFEVVLFPPNYPGSDCNPKRTYVDVVDFVSGATTLFERRIYVRDPNNGQQVLVATRTGMIGAGTLSFNDTFLAEPPCPAIPRQQASAPGAVGAPLPLMTANCDCPPETAARLPARKKRKPG